MSTVSSLIHGVSPPPKKQRSTDVLRHLLTVFPGLVPSPPRKDAISHSAHQQQLFPQSRVPASLLQLNVRRLPLRLDFANKVVMHVPVDRIRYK